MKPELLYPVKEPHIVSCDWYGLSVRFETLPFISPSLVPEGYDIKQLDGTNVWNSRYYILNQYGNKVATVLCDPKSHILNHLCGLIEVENEWLYHGIGAEGVCDLVSSMWPFEVMGFSRVDLCCDFCPSSAEFKLINQLSTGAAYVQGKRSGSQFWSTNTNAKLAPQYLNKRIPHCISWGHKTSNIRWKLYYKTKELLDMGGGNYFDKPYIVDMWRCAGMDISNVWRLEVSIKHGNQTMYDGAEVTPQTISQSVWPLYKSMLNSRFVIRNAEGHKDKSNDTIRQLIPVNHWSKDVKVKRYEDGECRNGRITLLRHLDASLQCHEVLCDDESRENVLWHMEQIIQGDRLENYFMSIHGCTFADYCEDARVRAYSSDWRMSHAES